MIIFTVLWTWIQLAFHWLRDNLWVLIIAAFGIILLMLRQKTQLADHLQKEIVTTKKVGEIRSTLIKYGPPVALAQIEEQHTEALAQLKVKDKEKVDALSKDPVALTRALLDAASDDS